MEVAKVVFVLLVGLLRQSWANQPIHQDYPVAFRDIGINECGRIGQVSLCCPGWSKNLRSQCLIPICGGFCGLKGQCIRPDVCRCSDGRVAYDCNTDEQETLPGSIQSDQPELSNIQRKPKESEKGTCYMKVERGLCSNPVYETVNKRFYETRPAELTQEQCCNIQGYAWGSKCVLCRDAKRFECPMGYRIADDHCIDIDECQYSTCSGGSCKNLEGSFECKCPETHSLNQQTLKCEPKLARTGYCDIYKNACGSRGFCKNLVGWNYECTCKAGYIQTLDKRDCIRDTKLTIQVCKIYGDRVCQNGRCVNKDSSYECACATGFRLTQDRKSCVPDINVCALFNKALCQNGVCVPMKKSYICHCNSGYKATYNQKACQSDATNTNVVYQTPSTRSYPIFMNRNMYTNSIRRVFQEVPETTQVIPLVINNSKVNQRANVRLVIDENGRGNAVQLQKTVDYVESCNKCLFSCDQSNDRCQCPYGSTYIGDGFCDYNYPIRNRIKLNIADDHIMYKISFEGDSTPSSAEEIWNSLTPTNELSQVCKVNNKKRTMFLLEKSLQGECYF